RARDFRSGGPMTARLRVGHGDSVATESRAAAIVPLALARQSAQSRSSNSEGALAPLSLRRRHVRREAVQGSLLAPLSLLRGHAARACARISAVMIALWTASVPVSAQSTGDTNYQVGVVSESGDAIRWFRPTEAGLELDRLVPIDPRPPERDGPHNITVSPDQQSYF